MLYFFYNRKIYRNHKRSLTPGQRTNGQLEGKKMDSNKIVLIIFGIMNVAMVGMFVHTKFEMKELYEQINSLWRERSELQQKLRELSGKFHKPYVVERHMPRPKTKQKAVDKKDKKEVNDFQKALEKIK